MTALACQIAAWGFLDTARQWKALGRPDEVSRLVRLARWHMTHSLRIG